ncbi:MAG: hypothetical protein KTU85_00680 [Acidimicrobiia bacterium]|nr:hypothetical protein [Acidimicrobiia bacterium]MCY4457739.1 hypothetical protein [Acidimicrobiaceae bacterium]
MIKNPKKLITVVSLILVAVFAVTTARVAHEAQSADAVAGVEASNSAGDDFAEIRKFESERLAGWGIEHREGFGGWVSLTGAEPGVHMPSLWLACMKS